MKKSLCLLLACACTLAWTCVAGAPARASAAWDACVGAWVLDDGDLYSDLTISREADGGLAIDASFYRMLAFHAALTPLDGEPWAEFSGEGFAGSLQLVEGTIVLWMDDCPALENSETFRDYFAAHDFVYTRRAVAGDSPWLGLWTADDGESIEVLEATDEALVLTYNGLLASGDGFFHSQYTLSFVDDTRTFAAEPDEVLDRAGWRYCFELRDDRIMMYSRSPEKAFYRDSEGEAAAPQPAGTPTYDGWFAWSVGDTELRTRTHVLDYVADGVWDITAMMRDLGYEKVGSGLFWKEFGDVTLRVHAEGVGSYNQAFDGSFWSWATEAREIDYVHFYVEDYGARWPERFVLGTSRNTEVSLDAMVAFTYAAERLIEEPTVDPLVGLLPYYESDRVYALSE